MGLKPRSIIKSWTFVAVDPFEDLLLGPSFGAAKVRYIWYGVVAYGTVRCDSVCRICKDAFIYFGYGVGQFCGILPV